MPTSSATSMEWPPTAGGGRARGLPETRKIAARVSGSPLALPPLTYALLLGWRRDRELLDDLVIAPLLWVVAHDLEHEVLRLLPVALVIERDLASEPAQLDLAGGRGHVLAAGGLGRL